MMPATANTPSPCSVTNRTTPYGYYSAAHRALIMNIATGGGTLVHEIVHPFVRANFPQMPGLAQRRPGLALRTMRRTRRPHRRLPELAAARVAARDQSRRCPVVQRAHRARPTANSTATIKARTTPRLVTCATTCKNKANSRSSITTFVANQKDDPDRLQDTGENALVSTTWRHLRRSGRSL